MEKRQHLIVKCNHDTGVKTDIMAVLNNYLNENDAVMDIVPIVLDLQLCPDCTNKMMAT